MDKAKTVHIEINGKQLIMETGVLARQAHGSVLVQYGQTVVFSAVTTSGKPREGADFFPLQVEYREKFYAAGRFPGGYFKREGRPTEKEILAARATDRPIRPLFPEGFFDEVQVNNTLLCADGENEPDILSIVAASASLMLSELPFAGPIGAVRVGRIKGQFVVNPTHTEMADSDLNLIYVGTRDLPLMIEGQANEVAEADVIAAMKIGHEAVVRICDAQLELRALRGLPPKVFVDRPMADAAHVQKARELAGNELAEALTIAGKLERQGKVSSIKDGLKAKLAEAFPEMTPVQFSRTFDTLEIETVRRNALEKGKRMDGRGFDDLRPLSGTVGFLPRTHGSAIFTRGETQALATVTLGTISDAQEMDALAGGPDEKRFMLHYNFPPYSVGEVGRLGGAGRREIGHGALAERCLHQVMPKDYPYTVRVVSEIMESNGSSSMASVCAGTLALMDAGVTITKPVAGISIGLITAPGKAQLLTDILGAEDHCGDMDFKVAGTQSGITGFQVDLKIRGLPWDLVDGAFEKARLARAKLLEFITKVIPAPRADLSEFAPRVQIVKINPEKIGALIGPGGKNIRRITDTTGAQIDIEDDGTVHIFATDKTAMEGAMYEVGLITAEAEIGKIYRGTVTGIKEFGAFVEIFPGKEGLVHISELADFRVRKVEDIVKMGDSVWVKCINVDEGSGKIRLSRRAALAEKDEAPAEQEQEAEPQQQ